MIEKTNNLIDRLITSQILVGLDVGYKTIGIAVSDRSFTIATPINTVNRKGTSKDLSQIKQYLNEYEIGGFIVGLPFGYETIIGERGSFLSGGQRQRLGIARALYRGAEILVFDEATSSLDLETEESVMNSIQLLNRNYTVLIISHRISSLKNCDKILNIQNGKLKRVNYENLG